MTISDTFKKASSYPFDLGRYSRDVSTSSDDAMQWFNFGINWLFGYNHEEAVLCFDRALQWDPDLFLAHWFKAYALGPNYNLPWEAVENKGEVVKRAINHLNAIDDGKLTEVEVDLKRSLLVRFPSNEVEAESCEDYSPFHDSYAQAMRELCGKHPHDLEIRFLFVESLMNRTPWKLWDLSSGLPSEGADTLEAADALETSFRSMAESWIHPGLLHLYIHLMEMSSHPEKALRHGDSLCRLVPDSGHLIHMSTHIDVLCGDYEKVVARNHRAAHVDKKFVDWAGADNFYTIYRCHNIHFKIYGAMFLAQPDAAFEAADDLIQSLPEDVVRPMADWLEAFIPMRQHVMVRFGQWDEILEQDMPQDEDLYCFTSALMRYSRAVALANLGDTSSAGREVALFYTARENVPESRNLFENSCKDILSIAEQMMLGEVEYHKGNLDAGFDHLRFGVKLSDTLNYDEPWGWMQPVRHALGALLLEQKRFDEAETVYREDLGLIDTLSRSCRHPNNVWSLHGLHECLMRRGEKSEIIHVKLLLEKALARSQVQIRSSCFCRKGGGEQNGNAKPSQCCSLE